MGQGKLALPAAGGVGERPSTWPKSSDSSRVSGIAAQLTLMNGILLRAAIVDGAGHELLTRAGFARDQHRAAGADTSSMRRITSVTARLWPTMPYR